MISSCCPLGALGEWWLLNQRGAVVTAAKLTQGFVLRQLWACGQCAGTPGGQCFAQDQGAGSDCCLYSVARCWSPSLLLCRAGHPHLPCEPFGLGCAARVPLLPSQGTSVIKYPCELSSTVTNVEGMIYLLLVLLESMCLLAWWYRKPIELPAYNFIFSVDS